MHDTEILQQMLAEIRISNKLVAVLITRGMKSEEQIELLAKTGLKSKDIAEVLGKTTNYVGVAMHRLRKAKPEIIDKEDGRAKAKSNNNTKAK